MTWFILCLKIFSVYWGDTNFALPIYLVNIIYIFQISSFHFKIHVPRKSFLTTETCPCSTRSWIMMAWETNINYDISQNISMLGRPFILMILYRIIVSYRERTFQNCFSFQFCHNEDLPLPSQCLVP